MKAYFKILLLTAFIPLVSCKSEYDISPEYAGVYEIEKREIHYFSDSTGNTDSIRIFENEGVISLVLTDPVTAVNPMQFDLKNGWFESWKDFPPNTVFHWGNATATDEVLYINNGPQGEDQLGEILMISYTVQNPGKKRQTWSWFKTDASGMLIKMERIEVKKM